MASSHECRHRSSNDTTRSDRRCIRRLLLLHLNKSPEPPNPADRSPLISAPPDPTPKKKKGFAFSALGCVSSASSQAFNPAAAAVRSSADWQEKRSRRRRAKIKKRRSSSGGGGDVWCAPGIAFSAEPPLDCVVALGRSDSERIHRERPCITRRGGNQEHVASFMDSPSNLETPTFGSDLLPSGHLRHLRGYRRRSPGGLEEILMFQTRLLLGPMNANDQYRDLRLDVDNMSYEELLELGDKIGHVSTGLREEEIFCSLSRTEKSFFDTSPFSFSSENMGWKCSICQEEYEVNEEIGKLECGHSYHTYCIKQWLLRKNACPVCKTAVANKGC